MDQNRLDQNRLDHDRLDQGRLDQGRTKDWRELCKAAASELDPARLMKLIAELTRALDQRDQRRKSEESTEGGTGTTSLRSEPVA